MHVDKHLQVEKDNAFEVKADLPGVKKEDIKVTGAPRLVKLLLLLHRLHLFVACRICLAVVLLSLF
jgi:hypothetical protein